jgi:hypothetical protein
MSEPAHQKSIRHRRRPKIRRRVPWSSAWGPSCGRRSLRCRMATVVFFIFVDPLVLRDITFPEFEITRMGGYTIAFFMFWAATAASSLFTWILLRPSSRFRN